jgi:RNase P subunit RPR2
VGVLIGIKLNNMPDLHCPECGKERFEKNLTMRVKDGETYYVEGQCECGAQMKLTNPKTGVANLGRMNPHGQSY